MVETLLHVSDSLAAAGTDPGRDGTDTERDGADSGRDGTNAGGLETAVQRAVERNVDAVVHTGNLFRKHDPDEATVEAVRAALEDLAAVDVPFFVIPGKRESYADRNPLDGISDHDAVRELSSSPTTLGEVTLFGVGYADTAETLRDRLASLQPANDFSYNVICAHQRIWPPVRESGSDISAYDLMETTDVYVDAVLAGGHESHRVWESDDFDYRVTYAGSTNPTVLDTGETAAGTLVEAGTDDHSYERVPLTDAGVGEELAQLRTALDFQPADVEDADTETLADLYGLAARAKSIYESRRKELRDELLERVNEDGTIRGEYAAVNRTTQERRSVKSDEAVFEAVDRAGIDREAVTSVDSSAVRDLSDDGELDADEVFDTEYRSYVRVSDTSV